MYFLGSSWVALSTTTGSAPSTVNPIWTLLAQQGLRGSVGAVGPQGPQGINGAAGGAGPNGATGPVGHARPGGRTGTGERALERARYSVRQARSDQPAPLEHRERLDLPEQLGQPGRRERQERREPPETSDLSDSPGRRERPAPLGHQEQPDPLEARRTYRTHWGDRRRWSDRSDPERKRHRPIRLHL